MEPSPLGMEKHEICTCLWKWSENSSEHTKVHVHRLRRARLNSCFLAELGQFETWRRISGSRYSFVKPWRCEAAAISQISQSFERKVALHRNPIPSIRCWRTVLVRRVQYGKGKANQFTATGADRSDLHNFCKKKSRFGNESETNAGSKLDWARHLPQQLEGYSSTGYQEMNFSFVLHEHKRFSSSFINSLHLTRAILPAQKE